MPRVTPNNKRGRGCKRGRGRGRGSSQACEQDHVQDQHQVSITSTPSNEQQLGQGRGRGRGASAQRGIKDVETALEAVQQAVSASGSSDLDVIGRNTLASRRMLARMPAGVRAEYTARKRQKQLERTLLPDAPSRKRARCESSPERSACRLTASTPAVPPAPIPQPREIREQERRLSAPPGSSAGAPAVLPAPIPHPLDIREQQRRVSATPSPGTTTSPAPSPVMCDWTTGGLRQDNTWLLNEPSRPKSVNTIPGSVVDGLNNIGENTASERAITSLPPAPTFSYCDDSPAGNSSQPQTLSQADEDTQRLNEWLDILSDAEDKDDDDEDDDVLPTTVLAIDFACEEPAHLPFEIDERLEHFMMRQDEEADRLMQGLMTTDNFTFDWTSDPETFLGQREEFVGPSGPTFPLETTERPIDIFLRFFDDEIFNLIVTETNRNAAKLTNKQQNSRLYNIKDTDRSEMAIFLAVLILQGLHPLPVEKDYFRENGYLTLKYFKNLMSYNRYVLLKRMLHFTDNDATTDDTTVDSVKLRQLGPLLKLLNSKFSSLYLPSRDIAIDESLLKWHGRLSFAQKILTKAAKVGIKTYELCESNTGYCWSFRIYTGKGHRHEQQTDELTTDAQLDGGLDATAPTNATAQIVLELVRPLLNKGHCLVMDNFYNSPLLARYLKLHGTDCYGTLRVNREFVPEVIKGFAKSHLRTGEMVQCYCRDISITLWRDTNLVAMLSTIHGGEVGGMEKNGKYKYRPQVALDYNLSMGGVDKKDQLLSAHPIERIRNVAWYKKVFRRLLNVAILNAYIIYKTCHPKCTQRDFRVTLANELIATFKSSEVPRPMDNTVRTLAVVQWRNQKRPLLLGNHFVGQGHSRYLKCVWCKKCRTRYICKQCNVSLCLDVCFEGYHTIM